MVEIEIGNNAPVFTLTDINLKKISLTDFENKVVLAFYPGAFTSVCTKEMCAFRDSLTKLNDMKTQVIGISVNDPFCNKAFSEINGLNFTLLSDYSREVVKIYGVAVEDFAGLKGYTAAKRSIFIIDDKGIVRYKWITEDPTVEPNYGEILSELEKIK
ncbi:peroxiredoxin [[Eubacterium] cellulosolvens]|jgi:peroxiredoxin